MKSNSKITYYVSSGNTALPEDYIFWLYECEKGKFWIHEDGSLSWVEPNEPGGWLESEYFEQWTKKIEL